jgi:hypothetical protein
MKVLKKLLRVLTNFYESLTLLQKILFFLSSISIIILCYISIKPLLTLYTTFGYISFCGVIILRYIEEYDKRIEILKFRKFYLTNIYNIFYHNINSIIKENPSLIEWINYDDNINIKSSSKLKLYLIEIKNSINLLKDNNSLSFKEIRTLYILNLRIESFLEEAGSIENINYGECFFDKPYTLNGKSVSLFIDIFNILNIDIFKYEQKYKFINLD